MRCASDCLELHGGNGYIEDWSLARLFRDAQVLPVWEGTTNMMVLDVVRSMVKDDAHETLFSYIKRRGTDDRVQSALLRLQDDSVEIISQGKTGQLDLAARLWCDRAFELAQAATLFDTAHDERTRRIADQFAMRHLQDANIDFIRQTRADYRPILAAAASLTCLA